MPRHSGIGMRRPKKKKIEQSNEALEIPPAPPAAPEPTDPPTPEHKQVNHMVSLALKDQAAAVGDVENLVFARAGSSWTQVSRMLALSLPASAAARARLNVLAGCRSACAQRTPICACCLRTWQDRSRDLL